MANVHKKNRTQFICSPILTILLLSGGLTACNGANNETSSNSLSSSSGVSTSSSPSPLSSSSAGNPIANLEQWQFILGINAGGDVVKTPEGITFEADSYFTNGSIYSTTQNIAGTTSPALYQTERYGDANYEIPLGSGRFKVVLKFAEQ